MVDLFKSVPGESILEKQEWLNEVKKILRIIAYPRRGTEEEYMDREQFAEVIQKN